MRYLLKLYYILYIRYLAIWWCTKTNLGNDVWYNGEKRTVINGVSPESWTLSYPYQEGVPRSQCRFVLRPYNLFRSYKSGVHFYTVNWLQIWCCTGLAKWKLRLPNLFPGKYKP